MRKSKSTKNDKKTLDRSSINSKSVNNKKSINLKKNRKTKWVNNVPLNLHFTPTMDLEGSSMSSSSINMLILKKLWKRGKKWKRTLNKESKKPHTSPKSTTTEVEDRASK